MLSTSMVEGSSSSKQEKESEEKYFVTDVVFSNDIRVLEYPESEDMKPKEKAFIIKNHQEKVKLEGEIKVYQEAKVSKAKTFVGELMDEDVFEEPDVFEDRMEEES